MGFPGRVGGPAPPTGLASCGTAGWAWVWDQSLTSACGCWAAGEAEGEGVLRWLGELLSSDWGLAAGEHFTVSRAQKFLAVSSYEPVLLWPPLIKESSSARDENKKIQGAATKLVK